MHSNCIGVIQQMIKQSSKKKGQKLALAAAQKNQTDDCSCLN